MNDITLRAIGAGTTVLGYAALCAAIFVREKRRQRTTSRAAAALAGDGAETPALVLFASQTGQAEAIAWQTARWLHAAGTPARVMTLDEVGNVAAFMASDLASGVTGTTINLTMGSMDD